MLKTIRDHSLTQWVILVLAVVAGIVILKTGAAYLNDGGIFGSIKRVILSV